MSFGDMHKNEVDASLISHETLNPTYQPVYNLDLDSLRLSLGPRRKIRAKKGRAKGINSIQDGAVSYEHSRLIEGDSTCRIMVAYACHSKINNCLSIFIAYFRFLYIFFVFIDLFG